MYRRQERLLIRHQGEVRKKNHLRRRTTHSQVTGYIRQMRHARGGGGNDGSRPPLFQVKGGALLSTCRGSGLHRDQRPTAIEPTKEKNEGRCDREEGEAGGLI